MTAVSSVYAQRFLMTLFLISFGIYLFLATVTYTPFDPGWMHISSDTQQVSNASGVAGAWIADLLFGFLGWASLLIPLFLFMEAIQVWWPRSFLNRPFRYAAQFFLILSLSSLLYLHWNMPADTLENAAGGIIGYELGQSLSQLLTIYGATLFLLIFGIVLITLAFGIQWDKTWVTLKNTPAYLQDLFYKNVPQTESAYDLTEQLTKETPAIKNKVKTESAVANTPEIKVVDLKQNDQSAKVEDSHHQQVAEKLFADVVAKEQQSVQSEEAHVIENFEQTLQKAHQLEAESQRLIQTGEVWRALQSDDISHKQEIDALLKAADDSDQHVSSYNTMQSQRIEPTLQRESGSNLDWNDDQIFDELLAAVPNNKTASKRPGTALY